MDVDVGWKYGNDDGVGAAGQFRHILTEDRRRRVDNHMPGIGRCAHLPRPGHPAVALEGRYAVNECLFRLPLLQPARARALGVIVGKQRTVTHAREIAGEIGRYRRFSRTALRVQDENALHVEVAYAAIGAMARA